VRDKDPLCLVSLYQYSGGVKQRSVNNKEPRLKLYERVEKRTMYWLRKYSWLVASTLLWWCVLWRDSIHVGAMQTTITDPNFEFGDEKYDVAIYRLIGNDMPPLQETGQLRWNTVYTLLHEPHFPGAKKKWILNRIWNETEFELLYRALLAHGVSRQDIIIRCFEYKVYERLPNQQEKMLYMTSQNEARNEGVLDGRAAGYEWTVILDGNTFITGDSWDRMKRALKQAQSINQSYVSVLLVSCI
jgi:hypothetical protein